MVSVKEPGLLLVRQTLSEAARDDALQPPHARAFAAWIQRDAGTSSPLLEQLATEAAAADGPSRQTAHVAVLGFASAVSPVFHEAFLAAVGWLMARQFYTAGRPLSFEVDGLGLLGTAVGLRTIDVVEAAPARTWLDALLHRSLQASRPADWNEGLIRAAREVLAVEFLGRNIGEAAPDLQVALSAKSFVQTNAAVRADAWDMISSLSTVDEMTRAAVQLTGMTILLRDTATVRLNATNVEEVGRLLSGVGRSMRRWSWDLKPRTPRSKPAKWEVENEYHVQDMLWSILAPVFPDLDDEEWLRSLGQHHPRADLAIPSLALIVEVKFLRSASPSAFSKIIQEVAADASTYLRDGSPYKHLIAFIWDDTATTEQHPELRQGIMSLTGMRDAIILPRPAKMSQSTATEEPVSSSQL